MLTIEARRHAHALRILLRSGRLARIRLPSDDGPDSSTVQAVVASLLGQLDALDFAMARGAPVDQALWEKAGEAIVNLHRLTLQLQYLAPDAEVH